MTILHYKETTLNKRLDDIKTDVGASGKLKLYTGTMPATVDTALSGNTLLAVLTCSSTFAAAAASHTLTANTITSDTSADASGTVTWGTVTTSADTRIIDFDVATTSASMIIDNTSINAGQVVSCSSFVIVAGNYSG